ncbi:PfaD family polyunsaturated fatty acid/polyketide biosynthesis protein [Saccharothrix xinjiangensis]
MVPGDAPPPTGRVVGHWVPTGRPAAFDAAGITELARCARDALFVLDGGAARGRGLGVDGRWAEPGEGGVPVLGVLPPLDPEGLGDRDFNAAHGTRLAYVAGEMANGIATTDLVVAMARADMLGVFGAAGLPTSVVAAAVDELAARLPDRRNWAVNLIHSPAEPRAEEDTARLLVERGVPCVSASAYLSLTPAVVRCAVAGLRRDRTGRVVRARRVVVKLSRPEVAARFLAPAPPEVLRELVERGQVTAAEAELAARVPLVDDVTAEADSGGHTDNRPLAVLLPAIAAVRDRMAREHGYPTAVRVGAAGGLGTPIAVAAAFAAGAAYVVTGSVNQCAVEAGLSAAAKEMLAQADIADVAMAPAADMFELGVTVQVLRRGTLFAARATRLHQVYRDHASLEALPEEVRTKLERDVFRAPVAEVWASTREFWRDRDPAELERADREPRHRMALVFRWYLGQASRWAITGDPLRRVDYQIWCGPAMGAFNRWVGGSRLADPAHRSAPLIAQALMDGAAACTRAHQLRAHGVPVPPDVAAPSA